MLTISDKEAAKEVSDAMKDVFARLEQSVAVVRARCDVDETQAYLQRVGDLFYNIIFKVQEHLYEQHPEMWPENWGERKPPLDPD
jgi:hypothetical protein